MYMEEDFHKKAGQREGLLLIITAAFVLCNATALSLALDGRIAWSHLWAPLVWTTAVALAYLLLTRFRPDHDPFYLPLFALLSGWGLILVDRLAANFLHRQVLWVVIGTAAMLIVAILPRNLRMLRHYRYTWLLAGLFLLASTLLFGVNPSGFGAALWLPIPLPFINMKVFLQPSELLKLLLVVFLASYFADREAALRRGQSRAGLRGALPYLAPLLLMWGFCMVLLIWQRDLGAATLYFLVFLALLYLATSDPRYVWFGLLLLLAAAAIAYFWFDVVALRIDAWWNPWPESLDRAFQIVQSLYAVAAGGVSGQGAGQGFPTYIPVVHSDFVFAAVAEEWGLIGSLGLVAVFMILTYRGFHSAMKSLRPFKTYLAVGITLLFAIQALMIMGGVTKILPLTGVTLPFISYGGSSLLISSIMLGLLLYLSSES
ncbi:MAG: FtsW/RodA/SpoVE family cell cycle protein [Candidatus Promineifilaceae bacterium]|jgi:cell division protein FtsW